MRAEDLYITADWLLSSFEANDIVNRVTKLTNSSKQAVNQLSKSSETKEASSVLSATDSLAIELKDALESISMGTLNYEQRVAFERMGGSEVFDKFMLSQLKIVASSSAKLRMSYPVIEALKRNIDQLTRRAKVLKDNIFPFIDDEELSDADNSAFAEVMFKNDASIRDIDDFKRWADDWQSIARGIAMVHGKNPRDVKVERVSSGSIIVTIGAVAGIILTLSKAVKYITEAMLKFQEYEIKKEQFKGTLGNLGDEADELLAKFDELNERRKDNLRDEVVEQVKQTIDDYKQEAENDLRKSVRQLIDFIEKGGDVDCLESGSLTEDDKQELKNIKTELASIRGRRSKLLLENKMNDNEGE